MINIALKCRKKKCKKNDNFHHYLTWFLVPISIIAPIFKTILINLNKKNISNFERLKRMKIDHFLN
jgi:beta-lactamase regulating signal transducer with metallopeptidase domain